MWNSHFHQRCGAMSFDSVPHHIWPATPMAGSTGNTLVSSPIITGPDSSQTLTLWKAMRIQNPLKDLQNIWGTGSIFRKKTSLTTWWSRASSRDQTSRSIVARLWLKGTWPAVRFELPLHLRLKCISFGQGIRSTNPNWHTTGSWPSESEEAKHLNWGSPYLAVDCPLIQEMNETKRHESWLLEKP